MIVIDENYFNSSLLSASIRTSHIDLNLLIAGLYDVLNGLSNGSGIENKIKIYIVLFFFGEF